METEVALRPGRVQRRVPAAVLPGTTDAVSLVRASYATFNAHDAAAMLALLTEDVRHDINESSTQVGRDAFRAFLTRMEAHYRERAEDVTVRVSADGARAAAEFTIHGAYLKTDDGLPQARGQTYMLPVGAFLDVYGGKTARVTTYCNLAEWSRQVSEGSARR